MMNHAAMTLMNVSDCGNAGAAVVLSCSLRDPCWPILLERLVVTLWLICLFDFDAD